MTEVELMHNSFQPSMWVILKYAPEALFARVRIIRTAFSILAKINSKGDLLPAIIRFNESADDHLNSCYVRKHIGQSIHFHVDYKVSGSSITRERYRKQVLTVSRMCTDSIIEKFLVLEEIY